MKRYNLETGYPMSTDKSIQRSIDELDRAILRRKKYPLNKKEQVKLAKHSYSKNAATSNLEQYLYSVNVINALKGNICYKKGLWKKAEQHWLKCIKSTPNQTALALAKMYHRQHRYIDEIDILNYGIQSWKKISFSTFNPDPSGPSEILRKRLDRQSLFCTKHKKDDKSIGFTPQEPDWDWDYIMELKKIKDSKNE